MAQYGREQMHSQAKDISLTVGGQVRTPIANRNETSKVYLKIKYEPKYTKGQITEREIIRVSKR
jgi:hypothetical protein